MRSYEFGPYKYYYINREGVGAQRGTETEDQGRNERQREVQSRKHTLGAFRQRPRPPTVSLFC